MQDIESDGRRITSSRDPPGQRSAYVAPGDPERETYRLSTFHHYPRNSSVDPRQFAAHGFYYTGYRDRVKCFSCGQCSENWVFGDDVTSPDWHDDNCDFTNGRDTTNIPILAFLRRRQTINSNGQSTLLNGNNTSVNHPHQPPQEIPSTENLSMSSSSYDAPLQHNYSIVNQQRHNFSHVRENSGSASSTSSVNGFSQTYPSHRRLSENLLNMFPCLHPINPHMRTTEGRLQTFLDNASIWPAHRIRATPQQIVDAGMYYLGERDRVKCWYCNGGLQNWERDDDPWEEHAKWFPLCEYVLQQKGPDYVHQIVARFPGLRRPTLYNPSTGHAAQTLVRNLWITPNQQNQTAPPLPQNGQNGHPQIIDPRQEIAKRNRKVSEEMRSSDNVAKAKLMGFNDGAIREALKRRFEANDRGFASFQDLIEAVLTVSDAAESVETHEEHAEPQPSSSAENSSLTPLQEMRKLEKSRRCKVCRKEDACVVFIPCGHLACCVACSEKVTQCPVCKENIREKLRSFLS